ncbi:hypothetical protein DPEC_G00200360 [Dallia pectoralis]|uniref:Uncharacterized protein n=1 Tax=Dallia pectoralis TaxID=75939 RepID=A0ACC2G8M8_DALPE|nr:hypothetical protein DPEC_G00200360 [Dallia pectoralis]
MFSQGPDAVQNLFVKNRQGPVVQTDRKCAYVLRVDFNNTPNPSIHTQHPQIAPENDFQPHKQTVDSEPERHAEVKSTRKE